MRFKPSPIVMSISHGLNTCCRIREFNGTRTAQFMKSCKHRNRIYVFVDGAFLIIAHEFGDYTNYTRNINVITLNRDIILIYRYTKILLFDFALRNNFGTVCTLLRLLRYFKQYDVVKALRTIRCEFKISWKSVSHECLNFCSLQWINCRGDKYDV